LHLSAAYVTAADRVHGFDEGADGYLTKPVEPQELVAHVKALVRLHKAEEQAHTAAVEWQATFDAISDGVCLVNGEGRVLRCNRALTQLLGQPIGSLTGRHLRDILAGCSPSGEKPFERVLQTRCRESVEMTLKDKWLQAIVDPVLAANGTVAGAVYILSDITEHKRLEAQLQHAQKMEAVGRLAGGIAHDFNNLLTGILGNVALLLAGLPGDDPRHEMLGTVDKLGWRAAELVRQLLGFSRRAPFRPRPVSLQHEAEEVLNLLRRVLDPRITVEGRFASDLWAASADPTQISQVLMNLCLNARDAMPEGGRLTVEVANVVLDDPTSRLQLGSRPGQFVRLRVDDTGHGMTPETLARLFEPFFTTKPLGKGTGLGLAMVFGIVQQHQGWIDCHSVPGKGTRFDIYLPTCASEPAATPAAPPAQSSTSGQETILFVDDEAEIRTLGRQWLESQGYQVLLAADGSEAVAAFRQHLEQVSLVVLNLSMPRLSGREVLRELAQMDPGVQVLWASGAGAEQASEIAAEGSYWFLTKPYTKDELLAAVRGVLRAKGPLVP
jgi:PAS domain S-box-containing protein